MLRGDKLGEGTFGIVYSGSSPRSNKQYAIKRNLVEEKTSFIGVPRELDVLNKLRHHPHIVRLERVAFDNPFQEGCFSPLIGEDRRSQQDDLIHFVFGKAAYDLHRFIYGAVMINFTLIKRYMVNLLLGVEYIHSQHILHRDLKPSNILIFAEEKDVMGNNNIAKICDFGLAKPFTYQGVQTPNTVTSWYRAPEITLGYPHYDYKADMWSVGCILFEMIARRAFVQDVRDNNDEILSRILASLPQELPIRKLRELVKSNKWRQVELTSASSPRIRRNIAQQIGLTSEACQQFEAQAGSFTSFCDLVENLLKFEWDLRYTATQALDHPFFADYQTLIDATRKQHIPRVLNEPKMIVRDCAERRWMAQAVIEIFNNRCALQWYSHRALFQAMDLFDRYLSVMFHVTTIPPNAVESDLKGFIHDKFGADLRFMTCLYLCIKYFSSIHYPISFDTIVAEEYQTKESKLIAQQFEGGFVKNCLEYHIYRDTVYEAADSYGHILEDKDIRDLIILYSMNHTFSGMTPTELYKYYRTHLRGHPLDVLYNSIVRETPPKTLSLSISQPVVSGTTGCDSTADLVAGYPYKPSQKLGPTPATMSLSNISTLFPPSIPLKGKSKVIELFPVDDKKTRMPQLIKQSDLIRPVARR